MLPIFKQGDLAKKKTYPTLWWLFRDKLLPTNIAFYGYARTKMTVEELRARCEPYMKVSTFKLYYLYTFFQENKSCYVDFCPCWVGVMDIIDCVMASISLHYMCDILYV